MPSYICITHALNDLTVAARLSDTLQAYGFPCRRIHEASEQAERPAVLRGAALVIGLLSPESRCVGTVAEDLHTWMSMGRPPLCICLGKDPADEPFLPSETEGEASFARAPECIPYPEGDSSDGVMDSLFLHRLFVRRLARLDAVFVPTQCRADAAGQAITYAYDAHRGNRVAAYALGCAYERGAGVPVLEAEAAAWITLAAEKGLAEAKLHLGELSLVGWGVEPDTARALSLFREVAETGDERAEYRLGLCYLNGVGVVADPRRAILHLSRAAERDHPPALFRLGLLTRDGIGTAPDLRHALQYLYRACRVGAEREAARLDSLTPTEEKMSTAAESTAPMMLDDATVESAEPVDALDPNGPLPAAPSNERVSETDAPAPSPIGVKLPMPPTLYGSRASRNGRFVSLRTLRPRLLELIGQRAARAASPSPATDTPSATGAFPFARSRHTAASRPEAEWFAALTRGGDATALSGAQISGHPALYMDRDDVALGIPFVLSDVAVAIGGLLASEGPAFESAGWLPHPTRALVWYRYALRRGNAEALFRLAEAYGHGRGTPRDPSWATVLYRMSAEWGDTRGQFAYAVACERGIGTETNMAEAIRYYQSAAEAGYAPAQSNLGGCCEYGIGVTQDLLTAAEWYTKAADAGLPEAMCRLGLCCECGRGVPADPAHAYELYIKAAERGNAYAHYRIGILVDTEAISPDESKAGASTAASSTLPRRTGAFNHWRYAARAGVADAAYAVAMCYAHGYGVRADRERALHYLHTAAERGSLCALYRLAMCRLEGNGVRPDPDRAVELLEAAIRLWHGGKSLYLAYAAPLPPHVHTPGEGAADALYMLGYCLMTGRGKVAGALPPAERVARARTLFSEAAELGHAGAAIAMGDLYTYGHLSAEDGSAESRQALARLYYMRAVLSSAERRGVPCPLSAEDEAFCRRSPLAGGSLDGASGEQPWRNALPRVAFPDPRAGGLLATQADALGIHSSPALLTLARELIPDDPHYDVRAFSAARDGSRSLWERAWLYFSDAALQGSSGAHAGMAFCTHFGLGTDKNPAATLHHLQRAVQLPNSGIRASLWLGDCYRAGWGGECRTLEADNAYLHGLTVTPTGFEVSPYILPERREEHLLPEKEARAELLYRLATFRSLMLSDEAYGDSPKDFHDGIDRRETFPYLAEAILLGHRAAREDLARMYVYEREVATGTPLREHRAWLSHYYINSWKEPKPFSYTMQVASIPSEIHDYTQVAVTIPMTTDALNYLGDCFFEGHGLPRSEVSAAACFREVVQIAKGIPRKDPTPASVVWSQYSLGWCLLKSREVRHNEREAALLLTTASRTHPEACLLLAECYEAGIGVDRIDENEAIKYRRRAEDLRRKAAEKRQRDAKMKGSNS